VVFPKALKVTEPALQTVPLGALEVTIKAEALLQDTLTVVVTLDNKVLTLYPLQVMVNIPQQG